MLFSIVIITKHSILIGSTTSSKHSKSVIFYYANYKTLYVMIRFHGYEIQSIQCTSESTFEKTPESKGDHTRREPKFEGSSDSKVVQKQREQ